MNAAYWKKVEPITATGGGITTENSRWWAYKRPNGTFEIPYYRIFDNEAAILRYFRESRTP